MIELSREQALDILDELDEFRRNHQNERKAPSDYCMRVMEAIVAKRAGYKSRADWTDELKQIPGAYRRDLKEKPWTF